MVTCKINMELTILRWHRTERLFQSYAVAVARHLHRCHVERTNRNWFQSIGKLRRVGKKFNERTATHGKNIKRRHMLSTNDSLYTAILNEFATRKETTKQDILWKKQIGDTILENDLKDLQEFRLQAVRENKLALLEIITNDINRARDQLVRLVL